MTIHTSDKVAGTQTQPVSAVGTIIHEVGDDFRQNLIALIPNLRAFARGLCGQRDQADDLCQEALVRSWASRASFEPGTNLKAWLFMILRNQFYSEKRRSWRNVAWDEDAAETSLVTGATQQDAAALSDVFGALQQLPFEQREALILVGAGGFAYHEAAKICGVAIGTVKSRVARGRRALETRLASPSKSGAALARPQTGGAATEIMAQLDTFASPQKVRA